MATNLHLVGLQYNVAAAVFFILYCAAEIPRYDVTYISIAYHLITLISNIALKLLRPSIWSEYV